MKLYRNEWKYDVNDIELQKMEEKVSHIMKLDDHADNGGLYRIHSLYFDDIYDRCAKENDIGVSRRYKYRIRYYDNNPDFLRLEKKEKYDGRCHKESCVITKEQYFQILENNFNEVLWDTDNKILREFCVACMAKGFRPKIIIDYERRAFVEPISNVRITFDRNIAMSYELDKFLIGDYLQIPIQEKEKHILEVKFDYILPSFIRHAITSEKLVQTAFSKYYLGRIKLQKVRN